MIGPIMRPGVAGDVDDMEQFVALFALVLEEIAKQRRDHPERPASLLGVPHQRIQECLHELEYEARQQQDGKPGTNRYAYICLEEVAEYELETDPAKRRVELVQMLACYFQRGVMEELKR